MRHIAGLVALVLLTQPAFAQQKRAMTFEDIASMHPLSGARMSPDGKHIAYVVETSDLAANTVDSDVWAVAVDGGAPRRLTTNPKKDRAPEWSPDGTRLAFLSERAGAPQVFLLPVLGGEPEQLTTLKGAVLSASWSPDGRTLAVIATQAPTEDEEKTVKGGDDAVTVDLNLKHTRLWLVNVATKEAKEAVARDFDAMDPQWSPDGRVIAMTVVPSSRADDRQHADIWTYDVASGTARRFTQNPGADTDARWSPDGQSLAHLSVPPGVTMLSQARLMVSPASGGAARDVIARSFIYQPGAPTWSTDGRTLYFSSATRTTSQVFSVPAAGGEPRAVTNVQGVLGGLFGFEGVSFSADRSRFASVTTSLIEPMELAVFDVANAAAPRTLSQHNAHAREWLAGRAEVVRWKSTDGLEVEGILVYPVGYEPGKKYPMATVVHGGPSGVWMQAFAASWYENAAPVWSAKGWFSFYPNPRGSSGYGEKFMLANVKDWGGGDYRDIQSGIDDLVKRGLADPDKLVQSGWSYGGYMTAWTLTQTNRFKAVMVGAGLTNMMSMYSTNDLQTLLEQYYGGEPWDVKPQYDRASAMTYIKNAKTPTLILHGQADTRVPIGQAQELYMGLKKNDVPVELVFFPREPHGLQEPRHQVDKLLREYAFLARYATGEGARVVP